MKRDMNLYRAILLKAEEAPARTMVDIQPEDFDERSNDELIEHVQLLEEEGLLEATFTRDGASIKRLTAQGHDFLDLSRNETVWKQALQRASQMGGSISLALVQELLKRIAAQILGL